MSLLFSFLFYFIRSKTRFCKNSNYYKHYKGHNNIPAYMQINRFPKKQIFALNVHNRSFRIFRYFLDFQLQ